MEKLEFKGTKGEWKITKSGKNPEVDGITCHIFTERSKRRVAWPAKCSTHGSIDGSGSWVISPSECEANAKLIAAAPELLEALQGLVNANINNKGESVMSKIEEAQKAIEKALK